MREIIRIPNQALRKPSKPIKDIDGLVKELVKDMSYYINLDYCAGLSAVQLGENIRLIAFKIGENDCFIINPKIVKAVGIRKAVESCLSIGRDKFYLVTRSKIVKVKGITLTGETIMVRSRDFIGQVLEHEIDHLNGRMIDEHGELLL